MDQAQQKPRRFHSKPLREIRHEQASVKTIIPRAPFKRLVSEQVGACGGPDFRIRKDAIDALQQGAEDHLVRMFNDVNRIAIQAKRETVHLKDVALWKTINAE
tara:strand:+ start:1907 stop:2215 length:309 start_codon:yes stop_codon:yes gene_type:complete